MLIRSNIGHGNHIIAYGNLKLVKTFTYQKSMSQKCSETLYIFGIAIMNSYCLLFLYDEVIHASHK